MRRTKVGPSSTTSWRPRITSMCASGVGGTKEYASASSAGAVSGVAVDSSGRRKGSTYVMRMCDPTPAAATASPKARRRARTADAASGAADAESAGTSSERTSHALLGSVAHAAASGGTACVAAASRRVVSA